MPRPFAVIGFTVFFTIAVLFNSDIRVTVAFLAFYAVALIVSLIVKASREQRVFPCAFAAGLIACILLISETVFFYQPSVGYADRTCKMSVQITDYPEMRYGNYYCDAETVEIDGEEVSHKIRLVFPSLPDAEPFDLVNGDFTVYVLGSSEEEYLASNKANGVFIGAYPNDGIYEVKHIPESEKPFMKSIVDIRRAINNSVNKAVPGDVGSLVSALLIGDKSRLPSDIENDFRISGITHIICVSGFHLSLWAMIILEILKFLRLKERLASVVASFGIVLFMLVAGMTYSVVRSGIMMLLYLLANVMLKKRDSLNSLGFALTAIAVYNPFAMGSVGLQLSALSSLGLILFSQNVKPEIDDKIDNIPNKHLASSVKSLITAFCVPVVASLFTLPITLGLYNEFNFAVFISNLIVVPLAGFCIFSGALTAFVSLIMPSVPNLFAYSTDFFGALLIRIARIFSEFDLLTFRADSDVHRIMLSGVLLICAMSVFIAYSGKNVYKITALLCSVIIVFGLIFSSVTIDNETRLTVIDVGNGTAVLASKDGENILFGCGGTEFFGSQNINDTVSKHGSEIDSLFIADKDDSSVSYLNDVLMNYQPSKIYCDDLPSGSDLLLSGTDKFALDEEYISENFDVSFCGNDCFLLANTDVSALICFDPVFDFSSLPDKCKKADIIIFRNDYPENIETKNCRLLVINSENKRGLIIQNELISHGFNAVATAGCGNILIRAENGYVNAYRTE